MHAIRTKGQLAAVVSLIAFAALASCSDDEKSSNGGGAGKAGSTGSGGKAGSAGSTAKGGTAGSAGSTAGTAGSTAGTAGSGGSGGSLGGAGGDDGQGGDPGLPGVMANYTFETDLQGWVVNAPATGAISTEQYHGGASSLKVTYPGPDTGAGGAGGEGGQPAVPSINPIIQISDPPAIPGSVVTFHLYVTSLEGVQYSQVFTQSKPDYSSFVTQSITLVAGQWNTITYQVPVDTVPPVRNIGIQLGVDGDYDGALYIDDVSWAM